MYYDLGSRVTFVGDTLYLTHSSETWGVDSKWIGKCRSRCIGTILLYHALYIAHKKTPRSWGQVEADVGSTIPHHDETRRANIERISYSYTYHANGPELVQAHLNVFTSPRITPSAPGQHLFATVPMEQHLGQQVNRLITLDRIAWNHQTDVLVITKNGKTAHRANILGFYYLWLGMTPMLSAPFNAQPGTDITRFVLHDILYNSSITKLKLVMDFQLTKGTLYFAHHASQGVYVVKIGANLTASQRSRAAHWSGRDWGGKWRPYFS